MHSHRIGSYVYLLQFEYLQNLCSSGSHAQLVFQYDGNMISVVCAIIERDEKILVARRPVAKFMGGKWELPGGKMEPGEQPQDAIVREIREELGCRIAIRAELAPYEHQYPDFAIRLIPLLCSAIDGEPRPLEHEEIIWAERGELMALDWADADIPIVAAYIATFPGASETSTPTEGSSDASGQ